MILINIFTKTINLFVFILFFFVYGFTFDKCSSLPDNYIFFIKSPHLYVSSKCKRRSEKIYRRPYTNDGVEMASIKKKKRRK